MQMFSLLISSETWNCNYSDVTSETKVVPKSVNIHTWILVFWLPKSLEYLETEAS